MNISIDIKQLKDLSKKLEKAGEKTLKIAELELDSAAFEVVQVAKVLCPVDNGVLKGSIARDRITKLSYKIGSNKNYAPYVEFGTGIRVSTPEEWAAFALQFKAPESELKGLRNGQYPQPYLYPAFKQGRRKFIDEMTQVIKDFNLE